MGVYYLTTTDDIYKILEKLRSVSAHFAQPALFHALREVLQKQHNSVLVKDAVEMAHKYRVDTLGGDLCVFSCQKDLHQYVFIY